MNSHRKFRYVTNWGFPGSLFQITEAWDGSEDLQTFIDRAVTWSGNPVAASDIIAQEIGYDAAMIVLGTKRDAEAELERLEAQVTNRRLREAVNDPTWVNAQEALIAVQRAIIKGE